MELLNTQGETFADLCSSLFVQLSLACCLVNSRCLPDLEDHRGRKIASSFLCHSLETAAGNPLICFLFLKDHIVFSVLKIIISYISPCLFFGYFREESNSCSCYRILPEAEVSHLALKTVFISAFQNTELAGNFIRVFLKKLWKNPNFFGQPSIM